MNVDSKVFLGKRFKDYYLRNEVEPPAGIEQREFGFGTPEDKIKTRHKSFKSHRELQNFLQRETPFYISYSAAYYEFPENRTMVDKVWKGADLVFDLDAEMPLLDSKKMEGVKEQAINLLEFLTSDFGLPSKSVVVNFSGGKGYHIHCRDDCVLGLNGEERREIVDYVTATGLDRNFFFHAVEAPEGVIYSRDPRRKPKVQSVMSVGPKAGAPGWAGRIYEGVVERVEKTNLSPDVKQKLLSSLAAGVWAGVEGFRDKSFDNAIMKYSVHLAEDTDKMVTLDTSRLIRLPGSLHGGSGLKAAVVKDMDEFNPLVDAVAFGDAEVKISIVKDVAKFSLMDRKFGPFKAGEVLALPEYASVYLMLKDYAEFVK